MSLNKQQLLNSLDTGDIILVKYATIYNYLRSFVIDKYDSVLLINRNGNDIQYIDIMDRGRKNIRPISEFISLVDIGFYHSVKYRKLNYPNDNILPGSTIHRFKTIKTMINELFQNESYTDLYQYVVRTFDIFPRNERRLSALLICAVYHKCNLINECNWREVTPDDFDSYNESSILRFVKPRYPAMCDYNGFFGLNTNYD